MAMHSILQEEDTSVLPPDMGREYLKVINYIKTADVARLKRTLCSFEDLKGFVCPDSGYNLIGVAILNHAPIRIINLLINLGVSLNGGETYDSKPPLKAIPFVNTQSEQMEVAYELVKAGARYDFYDDEKTLWLDLCKQCNQKLYAKIKKAIVDRAKHLGDLEEPSEDCLHSKNHKAIFFDARLAVNLKIAEMEQQHAELLELEPKILIAKKLAEETLDEEPGCSIKMQILDRTIGNATDKIIDLSINKTEPVNIEDNLKKIFKRSVRKFEAAKEIVKEMPNNLEANRIVSLYNRNGWGGAKLDSDLTNPASTNLSVFYRKRATL